MNSDIRLHQRLNNLKAPFTELQEAVELNEQRPLSKLEEQGLTQAFEYTYESQCFQSLSRNPNGNTVRIKSQRQLYPKL